MNPAITTHNVMRNRNDLMLLCEALTAIFMVKSLPIMEPRANIKPGIHHSLSKKMNMATATIVNAI